MTTHKLEKLPFYTLLIFIVAGSIGAGYFYTRSFLALSAVLYGVTALYIFNAKKLTFLPIHGFLLAFILLYWLAVGSAVDQEQAVLEAIKVSLLLPVSLLFSSLSGKRRDQIWVTWVWSGAGLTLWGLVFGLFREGRLESTLGYANVFAVIVAAGMAAGWRAFMRSNQKKYVVLCLIQLCGLLLSGSRAVLILVVMGAIAFVCINRKNKPGLLGGGVLIVLILVIVAGMIMNSGGSVREMTWNASEFELRRIYWLDAFHLWKEHWLAGIGGGGFAILYPSVYVKYVHQQFLQVALDAGVFGVLVFFAMIGSALNAARRQGRKGIVVILALLLFCAHLAFDIDLAYPLVFGLFIMLLTSMEMEGYSSCDRTINKPVRVVMLSLGMIIVVICSWFTAGYIFKGLGEHATAQQDWEVGKRWLKKAQVSIPWSSEVHYKQAFLYSSWAQAEQNQYFMDKAIEEMRMAAEMVPLSREYSRMLKKVGE